MARGTTTSTLTATKDNTEAAETIGDRAGELRSAPSVIPAQAGTQGWCEAVGGPASITSGPRRRPRRLSPNPSPPSLRERGARPLFPSPFQGEMQRGSAGDAGLPSAGRAGSGFPKTDRSRNSMGVAQYEPYDSARVVEGRSVIRGRVRCRSLIVARERRRRELEYKPVIDTTRSTKSEGHVARYGDVRRVRKVFVGCPASRPLRGQSPARMSFPRNIRSFRPPSSFRRRPESKGGAGGSMGQQRRSETVGNRLIQTNPTRPLPKIPGRGANPRTEKSERDEKAPKGPNSTRPEPSDQVAAIHPRSGQVNIHNLSQITKIARWITINH